MPGWTSLAMLIALFSTAQMACLAVLSIYVGRIFTQVKARPLFLVDEVVKSAGNCRTGRAVLTAAETLPKSSGRAPLLEAEFDKFADEYDAAHTKNLAITGEKPDHFARFKAQELRRVIARAGRSRAKDDP